MDYKKKGFFENIFASYVIPVVFIVVGAIACNGCANNSETNEINPNERQASTSEQAQPHIRRGPRPKQTQAPTVVAGKKPETAKTIDPTVVSYTEYRDPLIGFNRAVFAFNDVTYRYALIPLSKGYRNVVPKSVQAGIANFFYNIKTPIYTVNHVLQGSPKPAGKSLLRFCINLTVGILGFFDPARDWWHLAREETHFENTLGQYGSGYGIYLVLPFFDPSDTRNGASLVADYFLNPIPYWADSSDAMKIQVFDGFQSFTPKAEDYESLREKSKDPYVFFRNMRLQGLERDADY